VQRVGIKPKQQNTSVNKSGNKIEFWTVSKSLQFKLYCWFKATWRGLFWLLPTVDQLLATQFFWPFHVQSNAGPETRNEKGSYGECWRLKKWHRKDVWMRKPKQDSLDGANAGVDVCSPVPDLNRQFNQTVNASLGASILKMIFLIFCVCLCWSKSKND
jgi:hypothetical protein